MIRLIDAETDEELDLTRRLFRSYADEFAAWIAGALVLQDFDAEVAGLPGRYAPPSGCLVLAFKGDRSAGCVALRDLGQGTCEMKRLFVAPEFRQHGVGRQLVAEVVRRGQQAGYRRMVLDTIPELTSAVALYRSFGFTPIDRYWGNPVENTVFLEKTLND